MDLSGRSEWALGASAGSVPDSLGSHLLAQIEGRAPVQFSDVTVAFVGGSLARQPARRALHRVVLAVSPYFRARFEPHWTTAEAGEVRVSLEGDCIDEEVLDHVLR